MLCKHGVAGSNPTTSTTKATSANCACRFFRSGSRINPQPPRPLAGPPGDMRPPLRSGRCLHISDASHLRYSSTRLQAPRFAQRCPAERCSDAAKRNPTTSGSRINPARACRRLASLKGFYWSQFQRFITILLYRL